MNTKIIVVAVVVIAIVILAVVAIALLLPPPITTPTAFYIDALTKKQDVTVNTVKIESSGYKSFPADGQWHMVWQSTEKCDVNLFFPSGIGAGEYDIAWMPNGILKYSTDGIEWVSANLPGDILLKNVKVTIEGHVTVSLDSGME